MNREALFDTFNARNLTFEEVAGTFIPNKQFDELIENNHSLLMGPRGSGKTTLLKMLTPTSLQCWESKKALKYKGIIPFIGIYIPTDTQFKRQLDYLKEKLPLNDYNIIANTILTTNVLVHLSRTFIHLVGESKDNRIELEIKFTTTLIEVWKLERPISPTLYSIEQSLLKRVADINNTLNKILYDDQSIKKITYSNYFFDDFLPLCDFACSSFEEIFFNGKTTKWAFCFDELELAPEWLETLLIGYMRSTSQRFLFKLTTSPIIPLSRVITDLGATSIHDFRIVRTWPNNNIETKKWNRFCQELAEDRFERRFTFKVTANFLFGNNYYDRAGEFIFKNFKIGNNADRYGRKSFSWHLFKSCAKVDTSFENMLIKRNINPLDPVPADVYQRDTFFRKALPIAFFRYNFKNESGLRSRKNAPLYYGVPYIYEICDGNPRQLIGLLDELLKKVSRDERNLPKSLSIIEQSDAIKSLSERYLRLLETHPDANTVIDGKSINVKEVLDKIGAYFFEKIIQGPFPLDPVGSFIVDNIDQAYIKLLEFALAHGALVYINPSDGAAYEGIIGKKFRLSYLLMPNYRLPKREYTEVKLSIILSQKTKLKMPDVDKNGSQLSLF